MSTWYRDRRHLNEAAQDRRALATLYMLGTMPRSRAGPLTVARIVASR